MKPRLIEPKRDGAANVRWLASVGLGLAALGASCALPFWGLPVDSGSGGAPDGTPCSSDDECADGHCLPSNDGNGSVCCASGCTDNGVESCFTNGKCDAAGSGCALYPSGVFCGPVTCDGGFNISNQCQAGACVPGDPVACPGNLLCDAMNVCKTMCTSDSDCRINGATCNMLVPTFCISKTAGTECAQNDECFNQHCGTTGVGHCCAIACPVGEDACGPTDCTTDSGDCVFPGVDAPCGSGSTCDGEMLTSEYCNAAGGCVSGSVAKPCANHLRCADAFVCNTQCGMNDAPSDNNCAPGYFCNGQGCQPRNGPLSFCNRDGECTKGACVFHWCSL